MNMYNLMRDLTLVGVGGSIVINLYGLSTDFMYKKLGAENYFKWYAENFINPNYTIPLHIFCLLISVGILIFVFKSLK